MSEFNISIEGGTSYRLHTAGKFCDRDIVVTAEGGANIDEAEIPTKETLLSDTAKLGHVRFPAATNVSSDAFKGCTSLTSVDFPAATEVGFNVFEDCTSLTSVDFPAVTNIYENAFYHCTRLETLILRTTKTVCVIDMTAFDESGFLADSDLNYANRGHIYVPSVMYEYYRAGYEQPLESVLGDGAFDRIVRKIEDYPEICGTN